MITPETFARQQIDAILIAAGWVIQDVKAMNLSAGQGIALREVPLTGCRCDYLLLVDHLEIVGVLGPICRTFGERFWPLMEELNLSLAA